MTFDATTDPRARSWRPVPPASDFPIQNLPFGAFERAGEVRLGVAIGDAIFDLRVATVAGIFDDTLDDVRAVLAARGLGPLLARGRPAWRRVRERIAGVLAANDRTLHDAGIAEAAFVPRVGARMHLACDVADYVDFYSSLQHALNAGRIFRPGGDPLPPNWRSLPSGYHGRTGTIVPSGTPVVRPRGQMRDGEATVYRATRALDFELELGFITGAGSRASQTIDVRSARETIFGVALLNDWSARDIQAWESQPLGPMLGKSFATSLGAWIVTLDALEPYRVAGPVQDPPPLAYLATERAEGYDIALEVGLSSAAMRAAGDAETIVCRTNFRTQYWTIVQQLAHVASNGASVRAGDLFGTGTISGEAPGSWGSLLETTWRGTQSFALGDGSRRSYLEDGDEVVMRAACVATDRARIGFGEVRGTIVPALET